MITIHITYEIDPLKLSEFEVYARMWIPLVEKFGGKHHGYFLPHETASHIAYCLFSFESLAAYEIYRTNIFEDADCQAAFAYAKRTLCVRNVSRAFMKPIFPATFSSKT